MRRRMLIGAFVYVIVAVVLLPLVVTVVLGGFGAKGEKDMESVPEFVDEEDIFSSELEEYIVGVVAAEMPAAFPMDALRAQAVAARTYQIRKMQEAKSDKVLYDVRQAYINIAEQKEKWGENYRIYASKIRQAVRDTAGEIMVYNGEVILAVFHAQSGGMTEQSENVWHTSLPYLQSVDSRQDRWAPENEVEMIIDRGEVWEKISALGEIGGERGEFSVSILRRSEAGYVQEVQIGELILTGKQVRETLDLRSANFTVADFDESFVFVTKGYGHGAGMSQYGAKFLADEGKNYYEILAHYYQGISFEVIE